MTPFYPKRLIEVDLPIRRISEHARREKSIRHGHISTLHIWWARRPLAACRAVICAALWPDPADENCPRAFQKAAYNILLDFARKVTSDTKLANEHCSPENFKRWRKLAAGFGVPPSGGPASGKTARSQSAKTLPPEGGTPNLELRGALLDFIADFANWDNSTIKEYLDASRALTQAAHEALGGEPGTRPLVVDPFAGGGSIPLEALRVGADAFASDLNPVPVLLNKVVLEYIPKYGQRLADEVRKWGEWIKQEAEKELAEFYPKDKDGATPIAYLWARTIQCEGPGCGAEVPLIRSLWLTKKANRSVALQLVPRPRAKRVDFQIIVKQRGGWVNQDDPKQKITDPKFDGTLRRGSVTCPCCGYTTPIARVREQLKPRNGGSTDALLFCVVTQHPNEQGRFYRLANEWDLKAAQRAGKELARREAENKGPMPLIPDEPTPIGGGKGAGRAFSQRNYGMDAFGDLFTKRQMLALTTIARLVEAAGAMVRGSTTEATYADALQTLLGIGLSRLADRCSTVCRWDPTPTASGIINTFSRQVLPIVWDFAEGLPLEQKSGGWQPTLEWVAKVVEMAPQLVTTGTVERASATKHPLPDDSAHAFFTDPPYYDAVPYADLSKFFVVWLKRSVPQFAAEVNEADECIVDEVKGKDAVYFERTMKGAMAEGRRVLSPDGVGIVVFAHKSTAGWEAQLQAMIDAGWIMTGSWPIDTEMGNRLRAMDSAALASSVHLVCRPRPDAEAAQSEIGNRKSQMEEVGDWRDVLAELPRRIHDWMPRLADEGVVGADAIFACLGPALEIFSRYSRVEKASGEAVPLREYLEQVWSAVAKEALTMIFTGADATGFEEDARLTAMWLWTLKTEDGTTESTEDTEGEEDDEGGGKKGGAGGFVLEYDAARKIAQGLGAHLEDLQSLVEVAGETARLLPVNERARALFGKDAGKAPTIQRKREAQLDLFKALQQGEEAETTVSGTKVERVGETVLDRIHQSMILFAAGRSEALKRFLVEDGAGRDSRFWTLAQALSALYPSNTDEKRWVDGVLARKKGLGF